MNLRKTTKTKQMSYGEIYKSTWWGNPVDGGWGDVYYDLQSDPAFRITVDTTQSGSASDTFVLPLASGETYDFFVDWGDGSSETITSDSDVTHVYPSSGTYQISITGTFPRIYFNNGGDKLKLISIDNWGAIAWSSMYGAFWGCSNMNGTYTDAPDFSNVTNLGRMFQACSSFNSSVNDWNISNVTDINRVFALCSYFNQPLDNWNTTGITNMEAMFYNTGFKQSLASFDMTGVTNVTNMLFGCDINETGTTTNYDDTLIAWAAQNLVDGLNFNGGNSKYSTTGQTARQSIIDDDNWTITDGGLI